jgi:hypothetical protein
VYLGHSRRIPDPNYAPDFRRRIHCATRFTQFGRVGFVGHKSEPFPRRIGPKLDNETLEDSFPGKILVRRFRPTSDGFLHQSIDVPFDIHKLPLPWG